MARQILAREPFDWTSDDPRAEERLAARVKAFSRRYPRAYCLGVIIFSKCVMYAYARRAYGDVRHSWWGVPEGGYFVNGEFRPFRRGERIAHQNAACGCE